MNATTRMLYLLLLFIVLPLVELWLLVGLAGQVGWPSTIAIALLTGLLGSWLTRQQGLATLWRIRNESASGQMPADALFDGALILVAGAVLITPGILTDTFGFALLIPPIRAVVKRGLKHWFKNHVKLQTVTNGKVWTNQPQARRDDVIEAEVIDVKVTDNPE